jgi:8-oxo-dGTP diphosphatase
MPAKRKPANRTARAGDGEAAFLAEYDPRAFDRPSVALDVALISVAAGQLQTLLVQRLDHPFKGKWALPGGFLQMHESLDAGAERVLRTKAGLSGVYLEQLYTFGEPRRDPRTRVLSVAYYALVDAAQFAGAVGRSEVPTARIVVDWEGETGGAVETVDARGGALPLAFDHAEILGMAVKRLRGKLAYAPIGFQLLGERFTLLELQQAHETVLGHPLNKDSFRRRMLASGDLEATGRMQEGVEHRPAELYRFLRRSAV